MNFTCYLRTRHVDDHHDSMLERQIAAVERLVASTGGQITSTYVDLGISRSTPWPNRPQALRLLEALTNDDRDFDAVVVCEPQRSLCGPDLRLLVARCAKHQIGLWVPPIPGPVDLTNPTHQTILAALTGLPTDPYDSPIGEAHHRPRMASEQSRENSGKSKPARTFVVYQRVATNVPPDPQAEQARKAARIQAIHESSGELYRDENHDHSWTRPEPSNSRIQDSDTPPPPANHRAPSHDQSRNGDQVPHRNLPQQRRQSRKQHRGGN